MDSNNVDDHNKLSWLRQQALDEMLATERQYVNDLITLQQVFMDKTKEILPAVYRRDIFHSFDAVLGVAKMFLQELETLPIHFAFLKVANFFKVYTAYCAGYNNSLIALTQSRKSCRDWDKFLKDTENTQQTNFLSLASFLIKPVQRICRYPLMLKEILKHTPLSHTDFPLLSEALVLIEKITDHVNEGKRVAENMQRIVEIYNSFTDKEKPDICSPSRTLIREGDLMKISDGKMQNRHFFLFNDSVLYAKPTLLKKSEGLWVFCGQWALDRIQIVDLSSSLSPVSPSPFSIPSRASPTLFGNISLRGSGGSDIIRMSGGTSVLGSGSSPSIITTSPKIIEDRSIDDTSSTSSSPTVSPASTPFSSPSLSSVSSPSPSPSITETRRSSLVGNLSHKNPSHIPVINLTPPSSPSLLHGRRHSNTETERRVDGGLRSVAMMNIKDQRNSQEIVNPRAELKRSMSEGGGDEFFPIQEDSGKSSSDTESKGNTGSSINLVRSQSIENQKLLASLPDNAQHCFIVYAPVMGKPKRYIICAPDLRTKMLWLNDLLVQWRKATLLSQSRAVRQVSQELGDRLDSLTASDDENSFQFSTNPNIQITTNIETQANIAPKNTQSEVVKKEGNRSIRSNEEKKPNIQLQNQDGGSTQKTTRTERTEYPLNILGDKFDLTPEKLEQIGGPNNSTQKKYRSERSERERVGRVERSDNIGTNVTSDRRKDTDKEDRKLKGERYERAERKDLRESNELGERRDRVERKERREKDERGDRTDRSDRSDKSDRSDRSDRIGRVDKYDKNQRRLGKDSNSDWGYKSDISDKGYRSDISGDSLKSDSDREQRDRLERERRDRERTKARLLEKARQGINEKSTREMEAERKYGRNKEIRDKNEYKKENDRRDRRDREPTREPTRRQARDKYEDRGREREREDRIVSPRGKEEQKTDLLRNLTCEEENEELWAHIAFLEVSKEKDEKDERRKKDGEKKTQGMHSNSNPEKSGRLQATARNTKGTS